MSILSTQSRIAILAALLLVALSATARQDGETRGGRSGHRGPPDAEMRVAKMTQKLNLNDEQSAQLLAVMQANEAEKKALKDQVMEQLEPEFCDLKFRTEAEIAGILTDQQLVQLEEDKAKAEERRGGKKKLDCSAYE
jgi:Spy/CpxP family protein refolding chaperone